MKFTAKLQFIPASEIMKIIPSDVYQDIKSKDDHPLFQAYVVGHEGTVNANMVGLGQKVLTWFSSAVNKLWKNLQYGTKIFLGHNEDSSHAGRELIGEVVGKTLKTIKDRVSAIAVAYIYPEHRSLSLDVASIEADVRIDDTGDVHDIDVGEITGIALSNSLIDRPGFAGATLLSQIQAFANGDDNNKGGSNKMKTAKEIKEAIKEGGFEVDDLFDVKEIAKNKEVQDHFGEHGNYKRYERLQRKFDAKDKEWSAEKEKLETQIKETKTEAAKAKAADLFKEKAKERKLDDKQILYIERKRKKDEFKPEDPEQLEKEVDKFMDNVLDEYKEDANIFGGKSGDGGNGSGKEQTGGGEPGDETGDEGDASHIPD